MVQDPASVLIRFSIDQVIAARKVAIYLLGKKKAVSVPASPVKGRVGSCLCKISFLYITVEPLIYTRNYETEKGR